MRMGKVNPELLAELERAARALAERFPVKLVVLFGSVARGRARRDSDIDVAILVDPKRFDLDMAATLLGEAEALFPPGTNFALLNRAGSLLLWQVAKWGVPLYESERGLFHEFQIQAFRRYLDDEKFRRAEAEAVRRFVEEGRRIGG